ncbi:hypothetical protein [Roseospira navarrensis]|uniref:Uncharacterized protein n=1 Tax=Roseospira navarrensis TaxID=140058 RepID=A0A7X1ZBV1_9PROT|nr:hypothetical protein [Roseospira navarrensis]MQX35472.1 hypothetical protein [Roseospira navarrensis]
MLGNATLRAAPVAAAPPVGGTAPAYHPADIAAGYTYNPNPAPIPLPGNIQVGDRLFIWLQSDQSGGAVSTLPAGWSSLVSGTIDGHGCALLTRVADGTEGPTVMVDLFAAKGTAYVVWRTSGGGTPTVAVVESETRVTSITAPGVTGPTGPALAIALAAIGQYSPDVLTAPSGYGDLHQGVQSFTGLAAACFREVSDGAAGGGSWTWTTENPVYAVTLLVPGV